MGMEGALYGALASITAAGINAGASAGMTAQARKENNFYNTAAQIRAAGLQGATYEKYYSPSALLRQYKEAGLSPSMMFGGTPGQGGGSAPSGGGASGPTPPGIYGINPGEAAQIGLALAEIEKTKAETRNIDEDTTSKELENAYKQMSQTTYKKEFELLNSTWQSEEGKPTSLYEIAKNNYSFDDFLSEVRKGIEKGEDLNLKDLTTSEAGIKILRSIYVGASRMDRDIMTLSADTVNAKFQLDIVRAMESKGFSELNANAAIGYLKSNIQTSELTETQKEAWNNLISKLGTKGSTTRDIVVVLGMILNQAASNWKMPNISANNYNVNNNTTF